MYPGQHYGAQQQKAAVLQQQQQRQASQPHPYGQLSRRNSGSSLQPSFTASQHQLAAAQQLSSHHPAGQGYMGSFRINPMRQQAENYQRSTASYLQPGSYAINSQQQQPSRTMQPPPQLGLNSPSSSTVSSVASETFTSALRQHQSSMVNMESAFRQLEEENASLKAQLAAEREEKQGYALKLQKAVAEIQTKEQQILAYTIELARYRVLPGHM
ncbi:hypothetical protein EB796_014393 [Bugula neritina]|uniref:Uncharacterized protein n=1 Tax=Bugula neritina TaxID=10212 RepID=A0A7J7JLR6_BUGNE|nr:hypothetical protein EB796_014393 [Bugula neritina]